MSSCGIILEKNVHFLSSISIDSSSAFQVVPRIITKAKELPKECVFRNMGAHDPVFVFTVSVTIIIIFSIFNPLVYRVDQ